MVNTGNQAKAQPAIDQFFLNVQKKYLKKVSRPELPGDFELKHFEIYPIWAKIGRLEEKTPIGGPGVQPYSITILFYRGHALASVLETKTEFNFIEYSFALYEQPKEDE